MGMDTNDTHALTATAKSLALQSQICAAATRGLLQDLPSLGERSSNVETNSSNEASKTGIGNNESEGNHTFSHLLDNMLEYDKIVNPRTDIQKLYDNLNILCAQFPHQNTVTVQLDSSVPPILIAEDLLLFRCAMNLMTHCMGASKIHDCGMRIRNKKTASGHSCTDLVIECYQGGPPVSPEKAKELFRNKESLLAPVATMVQTLGGRFGMYDGNWTRDDTKKHNSRRQSSDGTAKDSPVASSVHPIYWIEIPYDLPESDPMDDGFPETQCEIHRPLAVGDSSGDQRKLSQMDLKTDPFLQASLVDMGCGNHGTTRVTAVTANQLNTNVRPQ